MGAGGRRAWGTGGAEAEAPLLAGDALFRLAHGPRWLEPCFWREFAGKKEPLGSYLVLKHRLRLCEIPSVYLTQGTPP